MATTSTRVSTITYSVDVIGTEILNAATNTASPGTVEIRTLASGANTITPPLGGSTPVACTIVPPADNLVTLTLKGITGDTGVLLHLTDPSSIALGSPTATFVLTTSAILTGIRLYWS